MLRRCLVAALLASACADQAPVTSDCARVSLAVSAGLQPTFTWAPACQIQALTVHLPGPGPVVWGTLSHPVQNGIAPPVHYGVFPPGTAQTANILQPLVAGTTYQVTRFRADGPGEPIRSIGEVTFTP